MITELREWAIVLFAFICVALFFQAGCDGKSKSFEWTFDGVHHVLTVGRER